MKYRSLVNSVLLVTITALLVVATIGVGGANSDENSLDNPGCEYDGLSLVEPSNWTQETGGQILCSDLNGDPVPPPPEGTYVFMPNNGDGTNASISQIINVSGNQAYNISGQVGTFGSLVDYLRIEVEYRDSTGTTLPEGQTGYDVYPESADSYKPFETSSVAPADAETAVIRVIAVNEDGSYPDAIFDDLNFTGTSRVPMANNIGGLEVDINDTLEVSVHDDFGNGADDLGDPVGNVSSFGGGDLSGAVTDHGANTTTPLAGGNLTIHANGTLELVDHTENGTYAFDYRLKNDAGSDDATVTITVIDNSSFDVSVVDANASVHEEDTWSIDAGVENIGTNVGTQNVSLSIENESGTTVHQDEQEAILAAGANDTLTFEWTPGGGSAGEYEAIVSSDDDSTSTNVTVYEFGSIKGSAVDANSKDPEQPVIESANVTVRYPDDTTVETTTNGTGEFTIENVPATGEEYAIEIVADGYHENTTTTFVNNSVPVDLGAIGLDGNATITGTVRDGATSDGIAGANATATTGLGSYEATTDGSGSYTIANVPGGQDYNVTITADGYEPNFTAGVSVGDGATHELNASLTGNATIEGAVESNASGRAIENASVTVVYPDDSAFTVENATGADGNFSITDVPGTNESYDVVVREVGFEDANVSITVNDGTTVDVGTISLLGNASVAGTVEDATFSTGVEGATVNVSNGQYNFTTTTDGAGGFVVEDVPGGGSYDVSIEANGWDVNSTTIAVGDGENVSNANVTITGSDVLEATVHDDLLFNHSSDDGLLDGATVTIEHSSLGSVNNTTDNGTVGSVPVPAGETYDLTVTKSGYDPHVLSNLQNGSLVTLYLEGNTTVNGTVTDGQTGDGFENATIAIEYPTGVNATIENATNATGAFAIDTVPGTGEEYNVTASADGYNESTTTVSVDGTGPVDAGMINLNGTAEVVGTVLDGATSEGLGGVNVTATTELGSYEATTDAAGSYVIGNVPGGQVYNLTIAADGYLSNSTSGLNVGDGATHELNASLTGNATIEGVVESNASGRAIENATATISYPSGDEFTVENATDGEGNFSIAGVPGTGESYDVVVREVGFEDANVSDTVGDGAVVDVGTLSLLGNASVTGTVEDATFSTGVEGITVHVSNGQYEFTTVTDGAGTFVVEELPGNQMYNVSVDQAGWEANWTTVEVADGEHVSGANITILGSDQLEATVYDQLLFENSSDDGFLDGATVTIEHSTFGSVNRTAVDGVVSPVSVPAGETYNLTATKSGYDPHVRTDVPNGSNVKFVLGGNTTIDGTVTDNLTGDGLTNATITVEYPTGVNATIENATNGTGSYAIDAVPGTGDEYIVNVSVDGYRNETATATVHGGTVTANIELLPAGEATVSGNATDEVTGSAIENANVTVELDDSSAPGGTVVYEGTTDGDGRYEFVEVIGGYDYNVSVVADGYENASQIENVSENGTTKIDLELAGNASISGTVVDSPFGVSLENASVTAVGSQGEYAAETDAGGSYTIDRVPGTDETYAVTVRADGYEANDTTVELGGVGDGAGVDLTLVGNATIIVTATDGVTGEPIAVDANVTVENATLGEVTKEDVTPNGADEYHVSVPGTGAVYNVTIATAGYKPGGEYTTGPLGSGEQATVTDTLLGAAELVGTVTDDTTGEPVANATVTATGPAGTYATETAADGTYTIEYVPGTGEQYTVTATARAYEDAEKSVSVPEAGATLNLDLVTQARFFGIEGIDAPDEVEEGETFEIEATVANLGSTDWNDSVELIFDGTAVANESVDLDAGNNTTVIFEHANDDVGTYDVQVRTSNESVNTTVDVVAKQSSSPSPPSSSPRRTDPVSPDVPDDVPVKHEEVGVIERDGETGRSAVTFSADSTVDWIVFDEEVEGSVGLAELDIESNETSVTDETDPAPGLGVAAYRIEVPVEAENSSATIRLRVSNDRLDELGVDPAALRVNRFADGEWQRLETSVVSSGEDGVVLEAWTPGFSNFSVTAMSEPEAVIDADPARAASGGEITLSAADSTDRHGEIVAYEWTVGDRTFTGETVTITLDEAGEYQVELTVTNADGESDTATATLTIDGTTEQPVEDKTSEGSGETPAETTSGGQPGFGLLAAGVALLVGILLVRRR